MLRSRRLRMFFVETFKTRFWHSFTVFAVCHHTFCFFLSISSSFILLNFSVAGISIVFCLFGLYLYISITDVFFLEFLPATDMDEQLVVGKFSSLFCFVTMPTIRASRKRSICILFLVTLK